MVLIKGGKMNMCTYNFKKYFSILDMPMHPSFQDS